jgi:DNA-binding MurR/RpiR family transcriptional regulator
MRSCLLAIKSNSARFSPSQNKIADYVVSNSNEVIFLPINELAKKLGISVSTVFTFVKKLGFSGYQEFKISLASETINATNSSVHLGKDASYKEMHRRIINMAKNELNQTVECFQETHFREAIQLLMQASSIYLFGIGSSGVIASEAFHQFSRLGLCCHLITDFHFQLIAATLIPKDSVAFVISQSGVNRDIHEILTILRQQSVKVIGLSNYSKTPFAKAVDLLVYSYDGEPINSLEGFSSRIPMISIIESMYQALYLQLKEKSISAASKTKTLFMNRSL